MVDDAQCSVCIFVYKFLSIDALVNIEKKYAR